MLGRCYQNEEKRLQVTPWLSGYTYACVSMCQGAATGPERGEAGEGNPVVNSTFLERSLVLPRLGSDDPHWEGRWGHANVEIALPTPRTAPSRVLPFPAPTEPTRYCQWPSAAAADRVDDRVALGGRPLHRHMDMR